MIKIRVEKSFHEFSDFVSLRTNWFVYENDELIRIHAKVRFINLDGMPNYTNYSSYDCQNMILTSKASRYDKK